MSNEPPRSGDYNRADIQVLEPVELIRRRPGMYIGDVHDGSGLHHLVGTVLDNCIDQSLAGLASEVTITLLEDGVVEVEDNGCGISAELVTTALTRWQRLPTFSDYMQLTAGYLFVISALSEFFELTTRRGGQEHRQRFERGRAVTDLEQTAQTTVTGTKVRMKRDPEIFGQVNFDSDAIARCLRDVAAMNPGLTTSLRRPGHPERRHRYARGVADLVNAMTRTRSAIQQDAIHGKANEERVTVDIAFKWVERGPGRVRSFVNNEPIRRSSTAISGFRRGIMRAAHAFSSRAKWAALEEGLVASISVLHPSPQFDQTGTRSALTNPEVDPLVAGVVEHALGVAVERDPGLFERVLARPRPRPLGGSLEHDRVLEAVARAPNDHEGNLVFADWLLERGDPRGEGLALRCMAARETDTDRRIALESHANDLLTVHGWGAAPSWWD